MRRMDAMLRGCAAPMLGVCLLTATLSGEDALPHTVSLLAAHSKSARDNALLVSREIEERAHDCGQSDDGTACSANFYVTAPVGEHLAERVLEAAERFRDQIAREWFGRQLADGVELTFIHVEVSDGRDVGLALLGKSRQTRCHRIWLTTSAERAVSSTLRHEIAHVVLSTRFPDGMPVWATEGISCRYDDDARQQIRDDTLDRCRRLSHWPSLGKLLDARSIEPTDTISYAASVSLTEYFLSRADQPTFLTFVADGERLGWSRALQAHYDIPDVPTLETSWREWINDLAHRQLPATAASVQRAPSRVSLNRP